tara:strand:+ start:231 stop:749 length:519 start_codon:yes stop_codon:yes gene_type:complete
MESLTIYTYPSPVLRQKALPVKVFDKEVSEIAKSMLESMYKSNGIGLAAVQAGILKKIVVLDLNSGEDDFNKRDPHIFINPKIIKKSGNTVSEEGCLSVIDFRGEIERAEKITLEYQDIEGKIKTIEADGMMSICLQHEIDHLDGILFIDHLPFLKQKMVKKRLSKLAKEIV